jgi:hypothetical protein
MPEEKEQGENVLPLSYIKNANSHGFSWASFTFLPALSPLPLAKGSAR